MKSDQGVVLIEMLVSIVVIGFIMLLLSNLMLLVTTTSNLERMFSKQLQVTSLIDQDILDATAVTVTPSCLTLQTNSKPIDYCFTDQNLVRTVGGQGYERLVSDVEGNFTVTDVISLELKYNEQQITIPLWRVNE